MYYIKCGIVKIVQSNDAIETSRTIFARNELADDKHFYTWNIELNAHIYFELRK